MQDIIKIHKVLADESRLRVLNLLMERSCCVCEVMQALEISQSKASRILSALHEAGILELHREGLWAVYSVDRTGMAPALKGIVEATTGAFSGNRQMAADRERLRDAERVGPGCVNKGETTRELHKLA